MRPQPYSLVVHVLTEVARGGGEDYLYPTDYFVIVDFPANAVRALRKSFAREASEAR